MSPLQKIKKATPNGWWGAVPTLLYALRVLCTQEFMFGFLLWNLWLAYLPVPIMRGYSERAHTGMKALRFFAWLLLLPNSFYLTTDFIHLRTGSGMPLWFDALMLGAFSMSGLAFGLQSLRAMDEKILPRLWPRLRWNALAAICFASGYGIYLGRIDRFNSWDVLFRPMALCTTLLHDVRHPLRNADVWCVTAIYGGITLLILALWLPPSWSRQKVG